MQEPTALRAILYTHRVTACDFVGFGDTGEVRFS